jgi:hypothetical protein
MKNPLRTSQILLFATLLVSILALPTVGTTQTGSNASLQDTLTWLTSFLPSATGATNNSQNSSMQETSSIAAVSGCSLTAVTVNSFPGKGLGSISYTGTFSLSDVDSSAVFQTLVPGSNLYSVYLVTRNSANLVKLTVQNGSDPPDIRFNSQVELGYFAEQASAQRVVNAFQHAAQLCANSQPF